MRPEPVLSARQRRLMAIDPPVPTVRQRSVIEQSDRTARRFQIRAERIAEREGIPYDVAAARVLAADRRASDQLGRRKYKGVGAKNNASR